MSDLMLPFGMPPIMVDFDDFQEMMAKIDRINHIESHVQEEKQAIKQRLIDAFHSHSNVYFSNPSYEECVEIIEKEFSES